MTSSLITEKELNLSNEINSLLTNLGQSPMEFSLACINKLNELQKIKNLSLANSIILCLLYAINEEWKHMQNQIKRASFIYEDKEAIKEILFLKLICKNFQNSPFTSLYTEIKYFTMHQDSLVSLVADAFSEVYEKKQIEFLSKLFISISEADFMLYFKPKYNNIQDLQVKYNFRLSNGYVYLKEKVFDYGRLHKSIENLEFINKNTTLLENNVRANPFTFNFPAESI